MLYNSIFIDLFNIWEMCRNFASKRIIQSVANAYATAHFLQLADK